MYEPNGRCDEDREHNRYSKCGRAQLNPLPARQMQFQITALSEHYYQGLEV
jgi:hypothetical protein